MSILRDVLTPPAAPAVVFEQAAITIELLHCYRSTPSPSMEIVKEQTATRVTDPLNDYLSPDGVALGVVGTNITNNNTMQNEVAL